MGSNAPGKPPFLRSKVRAHTHPVTACAVAPNERFVVSASQDHTLKVWHAESGYQLATLKGHTGPVTACAVTVDGRVVSVSEDGTLKVWSVAGSVALATVECRDAALRACALMADGRRAIAASDDGTLGLWDLQHGRLLGTLEGHAGRVNACAVTAHGRVVSASDDRTLRVWDLERGVVLRELRKLRPTVVHFSGYGSPCTDDAAGPDAAGPLGMDATSTSTAALLGDRSGGDPRSHGLFFQTSAGGARLVPTAALAETLGAAGGSVELVVLDACYSEPQAEALLAHASCVVGMTGVLSDEDALRFAIGFYGGVGEGASIVAAYRQGCAAISLDGLPGGARPQLLVRQGVDADQIVLATYPR